MNRPDPIEPMSDGRGDELPFIVRALITLALACLCMSAFAALAHLRPREALPAEEVAAR